ncbi:hypothetical protein H4R35_000809 [Dimargaris xerosporica]|nr:hypothetical protein H4R35_000809 [Dimargaris xerosporica]
MAPLPKRFIKPKPTTTSAKPPNSNDLVDAVHARVIQTIEQYGDDAFSESSTQYYHLMMVLQTLQMANANGWCHPVHRVYRHKIHMAQNYRQVNHDFLKPRAQSRPLHVVT